MALKITIPFPVFTLREESHLKGGGEITFHASRIYLFSKVVVVKHRLLSHVNSYTTHSHWQAGAVRLEPCTHLLS